MLISRSKTLSKTWNWVAFRQDWLNTCLRCCVMVQQKPRHPWHICALQCAGLPAKIMHTSWSPQCQGQSSSTKDIILGPAGQLYDSRTPGTAQSLGRKPTMARRGGATPCFCFVMEKRFFCVSVWSCQKTILISVCLVYSDVTSLLGLILNPFTDAFFCPVY